MRYPTYQERYGGGQGLASLYQQPQQQQQQQMNPMDAYSKYQQFAPESAGGNASYTSASTTGAPVSTAVPSSTGAAGGIGGGASAGGAGGGAAGGGIGGGSGMLASAGPYAAAAAGSYYLSKDEGPGGDVWDMMMLENLEKSIPNGVGAFFGKGWLWD